ncbi:MAG: DUF2442 domain-containing protein [Candidatus Baltobacteraceae bacterium]
MVKATIVALTDQAFAAAVAAGARTKALPTAVLRAWVHPIHAPASLGLSLELRNGASVTIPISEIEELAGKPAEELAKVTVDPLGEGLLWPSLDVGISAPGLLHDFFGYVTRAKIARAGGRRSTPAKAAAARANGRKGGRPQKHRHA